LSRGFDPDSCPSEPLVSYQTYRQLSGWNPPPLVMRAIEAHEIYGLGPCLLAVTTSIDDELHRPFRQRKHLAIEMSNLTKCNSGVPIAIAPRTLLSRRANSRELGALTHHVYASVSAFLS
jgi:hypothetical protein